MKARLLPLKGKYYGTEIEIIDDEGFEYVIRLWNSVNYEPSDRELDGICTIQQWRNNEFLPEVIDGWTGEKGVHAKEAVEICDSHFESRNTYKLAKRLTELINNEDS